MSDNATSARIRRFGDPFLRDQRTHLKNNRTAVRNAVLTPKCVPVRGGLGNPVKIDGVVDAANTAGGVQAGSQQTTTAVIADTITSSRGQLIPREARRFQRGARAGVCRSAGEDWSVKKILFSAVKPGQPGVGADKSDEMQVNNRRTIVREETGSRLRARSV